MFQLYISGSGAKSVAIRLNERGAFYRRGRRWSRKLVLHVLDEPAVAGTYYWGDAARSGSAGLATLTLVPLAVTSIATLAVYELAMKLRKQREPSRRPRRPAASANLLAGVVRCGKCSASYQLETPGKRVRDDSYEYRYCNCSKFCRVGRTVCGGYRIRTEALDEAVLAHLAKSICTQARADRLATKSHVADAGKLRRTWEALATGGGEISRSYVLHLLDRVEVRENEVEIHARVATQRRNGTQQNATLWRSRSSPTTVPTLLRKRSVSPSQSPERCQNLRRLEPPKSAYVNQFFLEGQPVSGLRHQDETLAKSEYIQVQVR